MNDPYMNPSAEVVDILRLLKRFHNVLISGPPGTGKSHLMAQVRYWFLKSVGSPVVNARRGANPLPATGSSSIPDADFPSPTRRNRKCWQMTFHQGTKHKDFMRGFVPTGNGFKVSDGPFYQSIIHGLNSDGASLVQIDEMNRGPAVAIFGDILTAIETDKRTLDDGTPGPQTADLRSIDNAGDQKAFQLSPHVYILAAMNEADTSVEPLDVAFRRRFHPYRLMPSEHILRSYFSITDAQATQPDVPLSALDIYSALIKAWAKTNELIEWLRGPEYRLGHGVFMFGITGVPRDIPGAFVYSHECWMRLHSHICELFFGDTRSLAYLLAAGKRGSPFALDEKFIADNQVQRIRVIHPLQPNQQLYEFLKVLAEAE